MKKMKREGLARDPPFQSDKLSLYTSLGNLLSYLYFLIVVKLKTNVKLLLRTLIVSQMQFTLS